MKRGRYGRKIQQLLILVLIWGYAFITGLSPSVVRASLMFSLIGMGNMMNRSHAGFNILAGAMLVQLWIDPYEITQVGFQLSYLAVMGIFAFYGSLNRWFAGSRRLAAWLWSIIAVSAAAQLATFPLTGYYFHLFPVYFLITNLIVVPLAGVVVYLSLAVLAAGLMHISFPWIAWPLRWCLEFMQGAVSFIQSLPGAVLEPVMLQGGQVLLIYLAVTGIYVFFILSKRAGLWLVLASLVPFFFWLGYQRLQRSFASGIVVYAIRGSTAMR
jgi:competence protein ComEC